MENIINLLNKIIEFIFLSFVILIVFIVPENFQNYIKIIMEILLNYPFIVIYFFVLYMSLKILKIGLKIKNGKLRNN